MPKAIPRNLFLWCTASIYLFAFVSLYFQIPGLYGKDGILPARLHLKQDCADNHEKCSYWSSVGECENNPNWMLKNCEISCNTCRGQRPISDSFWGKPTLLWFAPLVRLSVDSMMDLLCILGSLTAFCMLVHEKLRNFVLFAVLWVLYFSLYQAGQTFLWFQWDILLLETGFLAIFVAPWSRRSTYEEKPRDEITFWLIKWLIYRLMFQSGVVKLTSQCPTWWGLTALNYHYESQCIPTPLAWYAHQLPEWFQKFSVAMTFVIEIGIPFLFFSPWRPLKIFSFYSQVLLQALIMLTGNYNFFNILTIVLCFPLLDDQFFIDSIPSSISQALLPAKFHRPQPVKKTVIWKRVISLFMKIISAASIIHYTIKYFGFKVHKEKALLSDITFTKGEFSHFLSIAVPVSIGLAVLSFAFEVIQAFYICLMSKGIKQKIVSCLQTLFFASTAAWLFSISIVPYTEIDHKTHSNIWPVVHRWYQTADKYQIANAYGLFRRMTGVGGRPEIVIEGSNNLNGPWKEYQFHYKPGKLDRAPVFLIPHQPRLDWQMWFAALGSYQHNPWFISLVDKLLENKQDVLALLAKSPFPNNAPPQFIKSTLYLYAYTRLPRNTSSFSDGLIRARKIKNWWKRRNPTEYIPVLSKNNPDVKRFLLQAGLIVDGTWPENPSGLLYDLLMRLRPQFLHLDPSSAMISILVLVVIIKISKSVTLR